MSSSSNGTNPILHKIWKLVVPGKVKIFIWKSLHVVVRVKSILVNRYIGNDDQ